MTKPSMSVMILMVCILGSVFTACAGNPPPTPTATPSPEVTPTNPSDDASLINASGAFFALSVSEVNASAAWYSEKLGLQIVMQPPKENQSTVIVLEGGGLIVELIQNDEAQSLSEIAPTIKDRTLVHGIVKAGVIVDNFDKLVANLKERNVEIAFGPYPATAEQRANLIKRDNEGNLIQFFGK